MKLRNGRGILIYSAGQGLIKKKILYNSALISGPGNRNGYTYCVNIILRKEI